MDDIAILFCRPGPGSSLDDNFEIEADAVDALGMTTHVIRADHVVEGEADRAVRKLPRKSGRWLYRGPILTAEEYECLYEAVGDRGAELVVDPRAYEIATYVPEHHDAIADLAAPTRWSEGTDIDDAWEAARELGDPPWLLKDFVKSAKEAWEEACYVPQNASRDDFRRIAQALLDFREDRFQRGFVIRKFVDLAPSGVRTLKRRIPQEHRLFFWQGDIVAHAPYYPVDDPLGDVSTFAVLGARIGSPFFTADIGLLNDGGWIVVEINDGGTSGLPEDLDPRILYRAIRS